MKKISNFLNFKCWDKKAKHIVKTTEKLLFCLNLIFKKLIVVIMQCIEWRIFL